MFPQVLKDPLDRRLTKPCTWLGILHSSPSQFKTDSQILRTGPVSLASVIPLSGEGVRKPSPGDLPKVAAESELTGSLAISIRLSLCLATSTRLIVPPP